MLVKRQRPAQKLVHSIAEGTTLTINAVLQIPQLMGEAELALLRWRFELRAEAVAHSDLGLRFAQRLFNHLAGAYDWPPMAGLGTTLLPRLTFATIWLYALGGRHRRVGAVLGRLAQKLDLLLELGHPRLQLLDEGLLPEDDFD